MTIDKNGFLGNQIQEFIDLYREKYQDIFALTQEVNSLALDSMTRIKAHNKHVQEMIMASLYVRILSNFQACVILCERGMIPESRVLARSMIETVFTMRAISTDYKIAVEYVQEDKRNRLKNLNKYRTFHGGLPSNVDKAEIEAIEKALKEEIERNGIKARTTEEWANAGGLHDWYLTAYNYLSDSVHSKVRDFERYLIHDDQDNVVEFNWGPNDEELALVLVTVIEAQLIGLQTTIEFFDIQYANTIVALRERLKDLAARHLQGP